MLCEDCGAELPATTGTRRGGRQPRYCGGACRTRAYRARLTARRAGGPHAQALATLDEVEATLAQLRRAILTETTTTPAGTHRPPAQLAGRLAQTTSELARRLTPTTPSATPAPLAQLAPAEDAVEVLTAGQPVTDPLPELTAQPVTTPVTIPAANPGRASKSRRATRPEPLDLDTVRLEPITTEAGQNAGWSVLAGDPDTPIRIGTVEHARRGRWRALNANLVEVSGGPWRTRQDAVVGLLQQLQRAAGG